MYVDILSSFIVGSDSQTNINVRNDFFHSMHHFIISFIFRLQSRHLYQQSTVSEYCVHTMQKKSFSIHFQLQYSLIPFNSNVYKLSSHDNLWWWWHVNYMLWLTATHSHLYIVLYLCIPMPDVCMCVCVAWLSPLVLFSYHYLRYS